MSSFLIKFFKNTKIQTVVLTTIFALFFVGSFLQPYITMIGLNSNIFAILLILYLFLYSYFHKGNDIYYPFIVLIFWFVLRLISLCWGYDNQEGIRVVNTHFLTLSMMLILCFFVSKLQTDTKTTKCIFISCYISSLVVVLLQLLFHSPYQGVANRQVITLFGGQDDPNQLGAILNFAACFSLHYFVKNKNIYLKVLLALFVVITFVAICFTGSRGSLLSFALVSMFYLIYFLYKEKEKGVLHVLLIIVFLAAIVTLIIIFAFIYLPDNLIYRLFFDDYSDGSGRLIYWNESFLLVKEKPLFGYGWGGIYIRVHNTFLSMALDNGLLGLFLFLLFVTMILISAIKKKELLVISLIISSLTCSFFIEAITLRYLWISIFLGIIAINNSNQKVTGIAQTQDVKYYYIEL